MMAQVYIGTEWWHKNDGTIFKEIWKDEDFRFELLKEYTGCYDASFFVLPAKDF